MPRKNKAGGKPPQGPRVDQRELKAKAKALEAAKPDFAKAMGLSPEEFRRLGEVMRRYQEQWNTLQVNLPLGLKQYLEAIEQERRAKREAKAEAAAQEVAKQARRARRKGIGGRRPVMTPTEIEAARQRLRYAKNRRFDLAYKDFIKWWGQDAERAKRKPPATAPIGQKCFGQNAAIEFLQFHLSFCTRA